MSEPRKAHPSDLSDVEWAYLELYIPPVKTGGRPAKYPRRELVNAILYVLRVGGSWRHLPHDFPPWQSVYGYFRRWCQAGIWVQVHQQLRERWRVEIGRNPCPSVSALDSQSVKTTEKGATWLRHVQESERTQTASAGRYTRDAVGCAYHLCGSTG